jgi:hypothetical protein
LLHDFERNLGKGCHRGHVDRFDGALSVAGYKTPDFNERAAASRAAKQAALEQLRNKAAPDPGLVAERKAAQAARDAAAAERRAARELALEETKAAQLADKQSDAEALRAASPEPSEADLKAARDAKYAARKARKR